MPPKKAKDAPTVIPRRSTRLRKQSVDVTKPATSSSRDLKTTESAKKSKPVRKRHATEVVLKPGSKCKNVPRQEYVEKTVFRYDAVERKPLPRTIRVPLITLSSDEDEPKTQEPPRKLQQVRKRHATELVRKPRRKLKNVERQEDEEKYNYKCLFYKSKFASRRKETYSSDEDEPKTPVVSSKKSWTSSSLRRFGSDVSGSTTPKSHSSSSKSSDELENAKKTGDQKEKGKGASVHNNDADSDMPWDLAFEMYMKLHPELPILKSKKVEHVDDKKTVSKLVDVEMGSNSSVVCIGSPVVAQDKENSMRSGHSSPKSISKVPHQEKSSAANDIIDKELLTPENPVTLNSMLAKKVDLIQTSENSISSGHSSPNTISETTHQKELSAANDNIDKDLLATNVKNVVADDLEDRRKKLEKIDERSGSNPIVKGSDVPKTAGLTVKTSTSPSSTKVVDSKSAVAFELIDSTQEDGMLSNHTNSGSIRGIPGLMSPDRDAKSTRSGELITPNKYPDLSNVVALVPQLEGLQMTTPIKKYQEEVKKDPMLTHSEPAKIEQATSQLKPSQSMTPKKNDDPKSASPKSAKRVAIKSGPVMGPKKKKLRPVPRFEIPVINYPPGPMNEVPSRWNDFGLDPILEESEESDDDDSISSQDTIPPVSMQTKKDEEAACLVPTSQSTNTNALGKSTIIAKNPITSSVETETISMEDREKLDKWCRERSESIAKEADSLLGPKPTLKESTQVLLGNKGIATSSSPIYLNSNSPVISPSFEFPALTQNVVRPEDLEPFPTTSIFSELLDDSTYRKYQNSPGLPSNFLFESDESANSGGDDAQIDDPYDFLFNY